MLRPWTTHWVMFGLVCRAVAQYSSDLCSWRGSGLSHEAHRRDVEQVYLRCSQGSLEWLYPTGAIIVNLRPNTESSSRGTADVFVCIKPQTFSQGSHVYLEHEGDLRLLLSDADQAQGAVRCFSLKEGALFVEAVPQRDISRKITAFQYELVPSQGPGAHMYPYLHQGPVTCKPCSDQEVLMAVCTSDFAGCGTFGGAASGSNQHPVVTVTLRQLFQQKSGLFARGGARGQGWRGRVSVPAPCVVRPGEDEFLLTGSVHFGEAWLGCAPRYRDFLKLYAEAVSAGANPCHIDTN
ncbi:hypothetical protein CCH79_00014302 [Gambusia affinis]|uniref:Meteorin-like protein n=1 Tax=Gambusia affinis TaxID=33528 RepID=A0A315UXN4_GAMAF|nr:hypothetical protein CCH79_00014302 [Gambusia affinis]